MTSRSNQVRRHTDLSDYGFARVRDLAFDAVHALFRHRQETEGTQQKDIAARLECSPARINRTLSAPGNWTLRTFGELVEALGGDVQIIVRPVEDARAAERGNYDAYEEYAERLGHGDGRKPVVAPPALLGSILHPTMEVRGQQLGEKIENQTAGLQRPQGLSAGLQRSQSESARSRQYATDSASAQTFAKHAALGGDDMAQRQAA